MSLPIDIVETQFKQLFWEGFFIPEFKTSSIKNQWESLESINEIIVGPLYAIYENGHCDYIFEDKLRFDHIKSLDDFREALQDAIYKYKEGLDGIKTATETEAEDLRILYIQTDVKMELSEMAYILMGNRIK